MYNLHIYKKIRKLHVITYEWKYINIVNSCNFFLSEFEEMKSCIYRVETANAGMGLQWIWHHLFILPLEEIVLFTTKRVCKKQFLTRVCNHYPMLTLHIAGLRVYNGKSVIVKSWNIVRGKKATVPIPKEPRDTVDFLLERNIIHFRCFFQQHQTCQLHPMTFVLPIQWVQKHVLEEK